MDDENLTDITITIPEDPSAAPVVEATPPAVAEVVPPTAEPTPPPAQSDSPQEGIESLRRQLAERDNMLAHERERTQREVQERQRFERMAQENAGRAEQFRTQATDASYDSIVSGLSSAQAQQENLQAQLAEAMEKADFAQASKLNGELARVGARLERLDEQKIAFDNARKNRPPPQQQQPQQHPVQESPEQFMSRAWSQGEFDNYLSTRTPRTASWIRQNARLRDDPTLRGKVVGAHGYVTQTLNIPADTDEYFAKVQELSGMTQASTPAADPVSVAAAPAQARTSPTPAAPPSRSLPAAAGTNGAMQITLTAEERKTARLIMPPKLKDTDPDPEVLYARQKAQLMREGIIGRQGNG